MSVGISAVSAAATSSTTVAVDAPYVSSSQPPSRGANGIVVKLRNCELDLDLGELEKQPGGPAAAAVFRAQAGAWAHTLVDAAYAGPKQPGIHRSITDQTIRLTVAEARELVAEVNEVVRQWADRTRGRDPERQTYSFLSIIQPLPENGPE